MISSCYNLYYITKLAIILLLSLKHFCSSRAGVSSRWRPASPPWGCTWPATRLTRCLRQRASTHLPHQFLEVQTGSWEKTKQGMLITLKKRLPTRSAAWVRTNFKQLRNLWGAKLHRPNVAKRDQNSKLKKKVDLSSQEQCITACGLTLVRPHFVSAGSILGVILFQYGGQYLLNTGGNNCPILGVILVQYWG